MLSETERRCLRVIVQEASRAQYNVLWKALKQAQIAVHSARLMDLADPDLLARREQALKNAEQRVMLWEKANFRAADRVRWSKR